MTVSDGTTVVASCPMRPKGTVWPQVGEEHLAVSRFLLRLGMEKWPLEHRATWVGPTEYS